MFFKPDALNILNFNQDWINILIKFYVVDLHHFILKKLQSKTEMKISVMI